jgi:hypothetical protein
VKWYIPSWHGDLRLVPYAENPRQTLMVIERPTPDEQKTINALGAEFAKRGWVDNWTKFTTKNGLFSAKRWEFVINAPLVDLGPVVASIVKPGPAVLTAITFENGLCVTSSGGPAELAALAKSVYRESAAESAPDVVGELKPVVEVVVDKKQEKKELAIEPKAAATVSRPTPCCPQCMVGAVEPATEVLLSFLDPEQHASWARDRTITVEGGLTGNSYLLAHRNSKTAAKIGRICYDLDDQCVVHFHDLTVPPEEEVLAAKLILEHREPWLRNEATMLGLRGDRGIVFKNPFGDLQDGAADSAFMEDIGQMALSVLRAGGR